MTFVQRDGVVTGHLVGGGTVVDGAVVERCEIFSCDLDLPADPSRRPVFRNITMIDNIVSPMTLDGALVEDSVIDGVRVLGERNLLVVGGFVFRHVVLRGCFGAMNVVDTLSGHWSDEIRNAYHRANAEYWDAMMVRGDWALDISEISGEFSLRGIPAGLVRRDPETQVVMTFDQAFAGAWRSVPGIMDSVLLAKIDLLLSNGWRDAILSVSRERPGFAADIRILRGLQRIGAALPD